MKKMKRYSEGDVIETETAQGENKMIGDDTRARAMAAIAAGGVKDEEPAKPKKKKAKSQPESDREENSAWMREFRNKEAASAAKAKSEKTGFQLKKEKALGLKMGGKVAQLSKANGCAIRGKTKGRMV